MHARQQTLSLDGAAHGTLSGSTAVALFHGFTAGPVSVEPWARALAAAGAAVEAPLLPGHGTRWQDLERVTAADWRTTAQQTVDELLSRYPRVVVAGLSMGGALALDAAAHRPVSGAVVVNPALRFGAPAALLAPALRHLVRTVAPIANDTARPGADEQAYPRTPVAGVAQVGALQRAVRRGLACVQAPVLALASTTDHVVPASGLTLLGRRLRPGQLTVRPLENSFHVATLDWDAPLIHEQSVRFIAGLTERPERGLR